mmetsp:Transcript_17999/g.39247  ORF Transcript_17999/g.39247 Transcript_17999/m.39247 type:complete len:256 (+) Transcript_17999:401-1168(+)
MNTFPICASGHCVQFHFFGSSSSRRSVHGLVQDLYGEFQRLLNIGYAFLFLFSFFGTSFTTRLVFGFEQRLPRLVVRTDHGCLPSTIIPRRIGLVQLEAVVFVVTRKQKGDSERAKTSALGVELFVVADMLHELFDRDVFLVLISVPASPKTCLIDQNIGIGRQTGNITRNMGAELVCLFGGLDRCQETTGDPAFTGHYNSVFCQYTDTRSSIIDGFDGIFDLVKPAFGRKGCCRGIVATGHFYSINCNKKFELL